MLNSFKNTFWEKKDSHPVDYHAIQDHSINYSLPANVRNLEVQEVILAVILSMRGWQSDLRNFPDTWETPKYITGSTPSFIPRQLAKDVWTSCATLQQ